MSTTATPKNNSSSEADSVMETAISISPPVLAVGGGDDHDQSGDERCDKQDPEHDLDEQ